MNYAIRDANGRFTKFAADVIVEMLKEGAVKGRFVTADDEQLLYPAYTAINGDNGKPHKYYPHNISGRSYTSTLYWNSSKHPNKLDIVDFESQQDYEEFMTRFNAKLKEVVNNPTLPKAFVDEWGSCYIGDKNGYLCIFDPQGSEYGEILHESEHEDRIMCWQPIPLETALKVFTKKTFKGVDELKAARIVAAIQDCKLEGGLVCEYGTELNDLVVEVDHDPYARYPYIINGDYFTRGLIDENGNSGWKLTKGRDKACIRMAKRDLPKLRKSKTTGAIVLFTGIETGVELTNYLSDDDTRCSESYIPRDTYSQWQPLSVKEAIEALKGQK
jgi:hypothetical protein|nr:MAG TPA: hypothetical protein [Caudoviricetes sp.]